MMLLLRLFFTFLKIGLFTIGSGYSMLVLAQRYIVDAYKWLTIEELADVVAISEVTPGPFILNLATFVGTKVAGLKGAIFSTLGLCVVPFAALYVIALKYPQAKNSPHIHSLLKIARPVAIGFIAVAILNLFRISVTDLKSAIILAIVIALTYFFKVSPIFTVIGALVYWLIVR